ncbi:diguanylate cyclase [Arsenicitalea aurantiaca]|uniref:Diguanylate cyclase n=1 Tax=Arsenicitalea aurantiaca TaxID=1783274 RepID=A0A433X5E3_9HYPH|nr:diguanylate cyclase [Arsenicitalea aurantiaca]RUT29268.1 diguanylate cyclase [Arsenicitalea aurantiaca]
MHDAQRIAEDAPGAGLMRRLTGETATIALLEARLAAQERVIAEQAAQLAHSRKIFERASATARIGVWECDLDGEHLRWTDMVYDIFELPRGSAITRETTLALYTPTSRAKLQPVRNRLIEQGIGFSLDVEIVTAKGRHRWMRITATIEHENGVPVRIFGMKQDITEEKILADRTRYLALFDAMTGLANRSQFHDRLEALCANDSDTAIGALLLIDLDGFKPINDRFGHALGDHCLRVVAERLTDVCAGAELVARVGGDEFAVLLASEPAIADRSSRLADRIVTALSEPVLHENATLTLGASIGIAMADGLAPDDLFKRADLALYAAKDAGRGTYRIAE